METMCPPCSIIFQALGLAIPPRMHVDPSKSAAFYGIWPHVNDFGYSIPCQACCGHAAPHLTNCLVDAKTILLKLLTGAINLVRLPRPTATTIHSNATKIV
ncbi:hypothetical protein Peur_022371 [Populus x canadensis]